MNKIVSNIKNLLLNRNAITIIGVLVGVFVLWFIYNKTLTRAISPLRVPIATKDITAGTLITSEDYEFVEVSRDFAKKANVITSSANLINHYVNNGTSIAKGAMFYSSQVVTKDNLVERDLELIPEGYKIFWLKVDLTSTYANSIYPGDKIDLWLRIKHEITEGKIVYGEFITSIDVLSVKDSSGLNVFDVTDGSRRPAWLVFAVDNEMWQILSEIKNLGGLEIIPVPKNKQYTIRGAGIEYANDKMRTLIDSLVDTSINRSNNTSNNNQE